MLLATLLSASALGATPLPTAPELVPYADRARDYVERDDPAAHLGSPSEFDLGSFLSRRFVRIDLGLYRLLAPVEALGEADAVERLREAALSCAHAQTQLLELFELDAHEEDEPCAEEHAEELEEWIEDWRPKRLVQQHERHANAELEDRATAWLRSAGFDEELEECAGQLRETFTGEEFLGASDPNARPIDVFLMPRREDFVDFVCFAGWLYDDWQDAYWAEDLGTWTHCEVADFRVIALEYAAPSGSWKDGVSMNERTDTGLGQQVAQLALTEALGRALSPSVPAAFVTGLAMNLVVDAYDEVTTRVDGDLSTRSAEAREVFVPGGQSEGGVLPKNSAESRWRRQDGKYRFARVLRSAQKEGASAHRDRNDKAGKVRSFLLRSESGERHVVRAPFLGGEATTLASGEADGESEAFPEELHGDRAEFLRAYPCAFLHWLRSNAAGKRESDERFAALLRRLLSAESVSMDDTLQELYERKLSDAALDPKVSLEGGFLAWLGKQKSAK